VLAHTTARLLDACAGAAGSIGLLCAAAAVVALLVRVPGLLAAPGPVMLACVLALLPLERLMWLRVRFDAGLFTDLAAEMSRAAGRTDSALLACAALDAALHALRLRRPEGAMAGRPASASAAGPAGTPIAAPNDVPLHAAIQAPIDASIDAPIDTPMRAAPRPLGDRVQGARRLALRHALVALAQFVLLMSALALRLWA
jgi:hypothetical protein